MPNLRPTALISATARAVFGAGRDLVQVAGAALGAVRDRLGEDERSTPPPPRPAPPPPPKPAPQAKAPSPKPKAAAPAKPKATKPRATKAKPKAEARPKPKAKPKAKAKAEPKAKRKGQPRQAPDGVPASGFPEPPGKDPGDISGDPSPYAALSNPVVDDPDPTEWPDPYEQREDPRDPDDPDGAPFGEEPHPPSGSTSTSEPHPSQDPEAGDRWEGPKRDKLDD